MQVTFYDPSKFDALVLAFLDMGRHYFGDRAADEVSLRQILADGVLGPDSGVRVILAVDGERVAGFATISILYPGPGCRGQLFMKDLYVCSAWRGTGIGGQMMRFLAKYALNMGCVRFDWTSEDTNAGAMAFYERLGARKVKEKVYFRLTVPEIQALASQPAQGAA